MLALAQSQVEKAGIGNRITFICNEVSALPPQPSFDAALMIGVLHHIPEDTEKARLLEDIACRLSPRLEEHTSELQSLMRKAYAVLCLKTKIKKKSTTI